MAAIRRPQYDQGAAGSDLTRLAGEAARPAAERTRPQRRPGIWRAIAIFLIGGVFSTAFGVAAAIFVYPILFPRSEPMDTLTAEERRETVARGRLIHANPADPIHHGKGDVTVYRRVVHLDANFEVGPGPALHVYLSPRAEVRKSADVSGTMFVDLKA